jgi:hypothetical protein
MKLLLQSLNNHRGEGDGDAVGDLEFLMRKWKMDASWCFGACFLPGKEKVATSHLL